MQMSVHKITTGKTIRYSIISIAYIIKDQKHGTPSKIQDFIITEKIWIKKWILSQNLIGLIKTHQIAGQDCTIQLAEKLKRDRTQS